MSRMSVESRRAALVAAAFRVVAAHGVRGATTRAICAEADMALASFHYAFSSRDELMLELVTVALEKQRSSLLSELGPSETFRDTLRLGLARYLEVLRDDPPREKAMLELTQYALRTPGLEVLAGRQYEGYFELARDALETAAERWSLKFTRPVDELARVLVVITDGVTLSWLVTRDDVAADVALDFAADAVAGLAVAA